MIPADARSPARRITCLALVALAAGACGAEGLLPNSMQFVDQLAFVPAGAAMIQADSARFAASNASALAGVAPGSVRDDLSNLSGCWGAFVELPLGPFCAVTNADFYRFDLDAGNVTFQRLQHGPFGYQGGVERTYRVDEIQTDRLILRRTRLTVATAGFRPPDSPPIHESAAVAVGTLVVSVSGDEMVLLDADYITHFFRADCPP